MEIKKNEEDSVFQKADFKLNVKRLFIKSIRKECHVLNREISQKVEQVSENEDSWNQALQKKSEYKSEMDIDINSLNSDLEDEQYRLRGDAMRKNKGLYEFYWKRRRKSWNESECPMYFDTGKGYLLEIISENKIHKIEVDDFVKKVYEGTLGHYRYE